MTFHVRSLLDYTQRKLVPLSHIHCYTLNLTGIHEMIHTHGHILIFFTNGLRGFVIPPACVFPGRMITEQSCGELILYIPFTKDTTECGSGLWKDGQDADQNGEEEETNPQKS